MTTSALLAAALLLSCPSAARGPGVWHETMSPQLQVFHEAPFLPRGFMMEAGKIHGRLRMDMAMFAPWMSRDRIKIYLYKDREGFLKGEFHPPAWSNGIAYYDRRLIATYAQEGSRKTIEIIGHEMSHVLFESYWAEARKSPPVWLNEGLAMLMEAPDSSRPQDSDWHKAMAHLVEGKALPMARFLDITPMEDEARLGKETVTFWYVQAYSTVHFLYRRHTRLQFYQLVKGLRDGKGFPDLLWQVYRYRTPEDFEAAWRRWLKIPEGGGGVSSSPGPRPSASPEASGGRSSKKLRNLSFDGMGFKSLAPDGKR